MTLIYQILLTIFLAILSGILGRLGGRAKDGHWYDAISHTLSRDIGCSILSILTFFIWFGFKLDYWWIYLICIGLHWAAFSTYYDKLFGFDNLWFSGFLTGLTLLHLSIVYQILPFFFIRTFLLAIIWGLLNKFLPSKIFCWRRDIAEEFLRYNIIILTYLLGIIR